MGKRNVIIKVTSAFLAVVMVFGVALVSGILGKNNSNITASALSDEVVDKFVNIFYSAGSETAKEVTSVLKGEKEGSLEILEDIYSKVTAFYEIVDGADFDNLASGLAKETLTKVSWLYKIIDGSVKVIENSSSFADSTNAMQSVIDGIQIFEGYAKVCGFTFPSSFSLTLTAAEAGLAIGGYLETQYFKENASFYEAELQIAYYAGDALPYREAPNILIGSGVTQEEADAIFAQLYLKYQLKRMVDYVGDVEPEVQQVEYVEFASSSDISIFFNYSYTNQAGAFPTNAVGRGITYSSSDTSIATVDSNGKVSPVKSGTVEIKATAENGVYSTYKVTIYPFIAHSSNGEYIIDSYVGNGKNVVIPSHVNGTPVVSIDDGAFLECDSIVSVTISNGIKSIGEQAFIDCVNLTSVKIPGTVLTIGNKAFYNCVSLSEISIPNSVISIGNYAFFGCTNLSSLTIGRSVTNIAEYAFSHCKSLTSVTVPDSVTSIGEGAFSCCTNLKSAVIGVGVKTISYGLFYECTELVFVEISESVKIIDSGAFFNCLKLNEITLPRGLTSIGEKAFYNCTSLSKMSISSDIGRYAFFGCTNLSSVTIGSSVANIAEYAFSYCESLISITIPDNVISIGEGAFSNCYSLRTAIIGDGVESLSYGLFYECSVLNFVKVGDNVNSLAKYTFYNCINLKEVVIPASARVSSQSFYNCTNVNKITMSKGTGRVISGTLLSQWAALDSLKEVVIEDGVNNIDSYAFFYCTSLTSVIIPDSVTNIGNYAFRYCTSLASVTMGSGVEVIGNEAFRDCISLSSIIIPDSVTSVGSSAFSGCTSLSSIIIPDSVTSIASTAFSGCTSLEEIIVDKNNMYYSSDVDGVLFDKNKTTLIKYPTGSPITYYSIPEGVTTVIQNAFDDCSNLTSVTIPKSITNIYRRGFENCINITQVYYTGDIASWCEITFGMMEANPLCFAEEFYINNVPQYDIVITDSVTEIKKFAFCGYNGLISIKISSSVTTINAGAFDDCNNLKDVYYDGAEVQWNLISIEDGGNDCLNNANIHFAKANIEYAVEIFQNIRGTASVKTYKGKEYIAITMAEGKTMTGLYKDMVDGGTVELIDIVGTIQNRANDYVAYQSQNKTNPVATMKVTYADGTVETYPVVFELYEMEREVDLDISKNIRPIRGKASLAEDAKGEYILVEMVDGQSSVGVYKSTTDGSTTATLDGAEGMFTEQEKLYIFYGSQNTTNPEGRLTVTEADGSQKTYRIVFKMYEMDPYVNVAKGLRPVRGAVTFDADGTIRIKMTSGQKSVGLYKTMANGATFKIVDANGRMTNNPSSVMFYMTNNPANVTATMIFTLPDGTTKEQKIIFDMGLEDNPDPLVYLSAVRGTVSYQNDGTEDYIEVKANALSSGVGLNKDCLVKYTITDVEGIMTENDTRYYVYKSQNPDGLTANINFLQSDGSYKIYKVKFIF